jgi:hypothetical protein
MSAVARLSSAPPVPFHQGSLTHLANGGQPPFQFIPFLFEILNLLARHPSPPST